MSLGACDTVTEIRRRPLPRWIVCLAGLLLVMSGLSQEVRAQSEVERISFTPRSDGLGFVVRLHTSAHVGAYGMPRLNGSELEWTIHNTQLAEALQEDAPNGPVADYTLEREGEHLVLRFELNGEQDLTAEAYRDRGSSDLLLALNYGDERRPVASREQEEGASSSAGDRWRLDTVVIDAGHGGHDPGTSGYGLREKDVVLDIALQVGSYVEEQLGIDVVYTRTDDRFVELHERGRIANEAGGKLFVSIHANAAGNRSAYGTETYFLGMHRSESARRVMERENSVIELESNPEQYADLDEQQLIMQELTQSAYMRQSEHLAGLLEDQFANRVSRRSRGVKQAGFQVLWEASMPAVLIEVGFLSNRNEANFLGSEQGKTYIASAIFRAIRDFKQDYDRGLRLTVTQEE